MGMEPLVDVDDIQGNVLGGFNKDHQRLLFLRVDEQQVAAFRRWLGRRVPEIATSAEVIAFNRLFKELARRRGQPTGVKATWVNVAFSYPGLQKPERAIAPS